MSISSDIMTRFPETVMSVKVNKDAVHYGESAVEVTALLKDGRTVTGTFTDQPRAGFGGVEFSGPKNIPALMIAKIRSVINA